MPSGVQQAIDATRRERRESPLARDGMAFRAIARRDVVLLDHHERLGLPGMLVEDLRLSATDLSAFVHRAPLIHGRLYQSPPPLRPHYASAS